jgi:hypothetical protein
MPAVEVGCPEDVLLLGIPNDPANLLVVDIEAIRSLVTVAAASGMSPFELVGPIEDISGQREG